MKKKRYALGIAARIWFLSVFCFLMISFVILSNVYFYYSLEFIIILIAILPATTPGFIVLLIFIPGFGRRAPTYQTFVFYIILISLLTALLYAIAGLLFIGHVFSLRDRIWSNEGMFIVALIAGIFLSVLAAILFSGRAMLRYYQSNSPFIKNKQQINMETEKEYPLEHSETKSGTSNRILIKGAITAGLILLMMIPTAYVGELVKERSARQESVVKEVNSRWAEAQTLTGPYISLPYKTITKDKDNKFIESIEHILIIPDNMHVTGKIQQEIRKRSIYKVLLYRSALHDYGDIIPGIPKDISTESVMWQDAKICFGISDFKGIEEKMIIRLNGKDIELSPGLPSNEINEKGLSASIDLSPADIGRSIPFAMDIKIKGSEMLHFVPFGGNSDFTLESSWPNPSFDGNNLPSERTVTDSGFRAKWIFNKANLPFGTVLKNFKLDESELDFGVTMVQPADQYAKTDRSIKYAILIIGLTFSLFFIIELMMQKPIHPIQYVLIGLALVIFYSLLLSISEFIPFDFAYLVAAVSTILLIGLYAKSHFQNWKSAGIFSGILTLLYGFIFVLIRLEDTALLVGSIGLFIILAICMNVSRRVNWYGKTKPASAY